MAVRVTLVLWGRRENRGCDAWRPRFYTLGHIEGFSFHLGSFLVWGSGIRSMFDFDLFSFPLLIVFYILVTSFPVTFSASFKYIILTSSRCFPLHTTIIWVILVEWLLLTTFGYSNILYLLT